jgi:hypothetical protein
LTTETIEQIDPARTSLLVMDYQRGIVGQFPDADALLARARRSGGGRRCYATVTSASRALS